MSGAPGTSNTFGGIDFTLAPTQSILLSDLKTLSTDFYALNGGTGAGSPRFVVCLTATCSDFITGYLGPPPSFIEGPSTSFENDGNLVSMSNPDPRWANGNGCTTFPHSPPGCYAPYSAVFAFEETTHANKAKVYDIFVVIDSGFFFASATGPGTQTVLFKNIHINNQVFFNRVSCPEAGEDTDSKQENHEELCEQKANHGEQEDVKTESEDQWTEQNQHGADLSGEDLNTADFKGYDFSNANLQGADLSGSDLTAVNLAGADLSCSNLSNANLSGAKLIGAILQGADLTGANLAGVDLTGVITIGGIVCP